MKNKKAQIEEATEYIINFILVAIVAAFIAYVAWTFISESYQTHNIESKMLTSSLLSSESCLAYNDGFKTYPGILDLSKFSEQNLVSCFSRENMGYKVTLVDLDLNQIKSVSPNFRLNNYLPICSTQKGQYECSLKENYVLYYNNEKLNPGILMTEVITLV